MRRAEPPAGFTQFSIGRTTVVCAPHVADALRTVLAAGTVYDFAASHPNSRSLAGRVTAYAVALPGDVERIVVRRNHHGGLLGGLTGDLFLTPTRAPYELATSLELLSAGVPTPAILGYATYRASPGFCRVDVMSREVENSSDLSHALLLDDAEARTAALRATAHLVATMSAAGARHHDLNVKNVLLRGPTAAEALVLDVDRAVFGETRANALRENLARILRSARKWQRLYGARVTDAELESFEREARAESAARTTSS
jgi:tRNA A-37 threonylcarbamoyl transferase component Bud32